MHLQETFVSTKGRVKKGIKEYRKVEKKLST